MEWAYRRQRRPLDYDDLFFAAGNGSRNSLLTSSLTKYFQRIAAWSGSE